MAESRATKQESAEREVENFQSALGPFVVAAETTRMAMIFTNARESGNPIVFANDSFLELLGYDRDEVLGRPLAFVMARDGDPAARTYTRSELQGVTDENLETECRRKDGRTFPAAIHISPVHDEQGIIVQHFASFVDLTGWTEWVQRERDALHVLYQNTPGFIAITEGPDHCFTFANAAFQQLVGHQNIVGKTIAEVLPELIEQGFIGRLDKVYATGKSTFGAKVPISIRHGTDAACDLHFIDFAFQPVRDAQDRVTGLFCAGNDVTAQEDALERILLLQAELIHVTRVSAMGTMATTLAHELNQPLTAISNYAAGCLLSLGSDPSDVDALSSDLRAIGESSQRAGDIIRRLRAMTERRTMKRDLFDLSAAVRESVDLVRAGCRSASIEATNNSPVMVEADRVQIQQVIINLAKNGCEAAEAASDGHVTVSTLIEGDRAVVSVEDTGTGVNREAAANLFQWTPSGKTDGMGVGLSISRTIIEAHQGRIWLEKGGERPTRFRFSLPITERLRDGKKNGSRAEGRGIPSPAPPGHAPLARA